MPEVVLVTGLVVGVVCVGTVCIVFARYRTFGFGGSVLCFTGLLLIGLSVWKNAEVQVGDNGVIVKVTALEDSVQSLKDASAALSTQVQSVAKATDAIRPVALARPVYDAEGFKRIDASLATSSQALSRARQIPTR